MTTTLAITPVPPTVIACPAQPGPEYQVILPPSVEIGGSAGRQVEGFVDVAHFAWICRSPPA